MRSLLPLLIFLSHFTVEASNYYFSTTGNDANAGTSANAPWQTISKFNSVSKSFSPGDSILFKRGDVFYGGITIGRVSASPIILAAYGTGPDPVITGFTTVRDWRSIGNNIWESTKAVSTLSTLNMVIINGVNAPIGRYPNRGYLTYESFTNTSITSSSLNPAATDWTGAIAVIRKNNWITDRDTIIKQSGNTLVHTAHSIYNGIKNYGFFIQNDPKTLDQQNEWYYNPFTKKLRIYSKNSPTNVQASTIDTLVSINGANNITFTNISFAGSNKATFAVNFSQNLHILACNIDFSGENAVITRGGKCNSFKLINSTINHTNNNAVDLGGASPDCLLSYDTIKNTALIAGMGLGADGNYIAVQTNSDNGLIENCFVDSTGYNAIVFYGNNTIIRNNLVSNFCITKFDGGGIYTFISIGGKPATGQKLINNIVINGIGNAAGTTEKIPLVHGIYLDEGTANVEIAGNTIANNSYSGLYYHSSYSNNVHDNTLYNNNYCQFLMADYNAKNPERKLKFRNNILVSKRATQMILSFQSRANDIVNFGGPADIDYNYYLSPLDNNKAIETISNNHEKTSHGLLTDWQSYSGYDKHSSMSTLTATEENDLRFEYNEKGINKIIPLDANYVDVVNKPYFYTVTLKPYSSLILIRK